MKFNELFTIFTEAFDADAEMLSADEKAKVDARREQARLDKEQKESDEEDLTFQGNRQKQEKVLILWRRIQSLKPHLFSEYDLKYEPRKVLYYDPEENQGDIEFESDELTKEDLEYISSLKYLESFSISVKKDRRLVLNFKIYTVNNIMKFDELCKQLLAKYNVVLENFDDEDEEEIETVSIDGEYWFDESGNTMYADGDIGDMNHEAYVIQGCAGEIASHFDMYVDELYMESMEEEILDRIISELKSNPESTIIDYIENQFHYGKEEATEIVTNAFAAYDAEEALEKLGNILGIKDATTSKIEEQIFSELKDEMKNDPADAIIKQMVKDTGKSEKEISELVMTAYGSTGDAREYAIKNWDWSRVHGDSIEVKELDRGTLRLVAAGINNALEEEGKWDQYEPEQLDEHEYTISTYSGKRYTIKLKDMVSGNVEGLERADLEIKTSAATQQLRQADINDMPDFYKQRGVIGDSVQYDA